MTDDFDLVLNVDSPPDEVLNRLAVLAGGKLNEEAELFIMPELWVVVTSVEHPVMREIYQDAWGVNMRISVSFFVGYKFDFDSRDRALDLMSVSAVKLATAMKCEAGMVNEYDHKIMRRTGDSLYLYDWWPQWSDSAVVSQLPRPFTIDHEDSST